MKPLKERWGQFFGLVLDPWTAALLLSMIAMFIATQFEAAKLTSALLFVIITVASALLGARVTQQWIEMNEGGVLRARGKSAVRSLKLLLRNIAALERRLENFASNQQHIRENPDVTLRNYEEAIENCRMLAEEAISSVENWTDIVPEADISTQIGMISELKVSLEGKESELQQLQDQLTAAKDASATERSELARRIRDKERQTEELEREIRAHKASAGLSSFLSNVGTPAISLGTPSKGFVQGLLDADPGAPRVGLRRKTLGENG